MNACTMWLYTCFVFPMTMALLTQLDEKCNNVSFFLSILFTGICFHLFGGERGCALSFSFLLNWACDKDKALAIGLDNIMNAGQNLQWKLWREKSKGEEGKEILLCNYSKNSNIQCTRNQLHGQLWLHDHQHSIHQSCYFEFILQWLLTGFQGTNPKEAFSVDGWAGKSNKVTESRVEHWNSPVQEKNKPTHSGLSQCVFCIWRNKSNEILLFILFDPQRIWPHQQHPQPGQINQHGHN